MMCNESSSSPIFRRVFDIMRRDESAEMQFEKVFNIGDQLTLLQRLAPLVQCIIRCVDFHYIIYKIINDVLQI